MHANCFDLPLQKWFDFKVPKTLVAPDYIRTAIEEPEFNSKNINSKVIWLGKPPKAEVIVKSKKGHQWEVMSLTFQTRKTTHTIQVEPAKGKWLMNLLPRLSVDHPVQLTLQQTMADYESSGLEDFELFWDNKPVNTLYKTGLLHL
jgi:hypothetical protein